MASTLDTLEAVTTSTAGTPDPHAAGACRIGRVARALLDEDPRQAVIYFHGSFLGPGSPEALAAGLMGFAPDDERLPRSLGLAGQAGLDLVFDAIELGPAAHPHSAMISLKGAGRSLSLTAASVGGGGICIQEIDGLPAKIRGTLETLVLWHPDTPGSLAEVEVVLACGQINAATIRTGRIEWRGGRAITAIEVNGRLPKEVLARLRASPSISRLVALPVLPGR